MHSPHPNNLFISISKKSEIMFDANRVIVQSNKNHCQHQKNPGKYNKSFQKGKAYPNILITIFDRIFTICHNM